MLLRRVIDHVREQNWTAIGIDFVIVVVGVFVGIQVSNWNDSRRGAEQQQRHMERLAADFRSIQQRIDRHFATFEEIIEGANYITQMLRLPEAEFRELAVDQQRLQEAASILDHTRIPPGSSATYLEMVSAGQLSALGNPVLRDKLAEYERLARIHLEVHRMSVAQIAPQRPILFRHYKVETALDAEALSGIRMEATRIDLEGMRSDPEFEIAVMIVQTATRNNYGLRRLEARVVDEILTLLEAELAR